MPNPLSIRLGWKVKVHPDHYDMVEAGIDYSGERNDGETIEEAVQRLSFEAQLGLLELTIKQVEALNNLRSVPKQDILRWILNQVQITQEQREALRRKLSK